MMQSASLFACFSRSVERFPDRPALSFGAHEITYAALSRAAAGLGVVIRERKPATSIDLVSFFAYRSIAAYTAALGILASGNGYVPLNPRFPARRNRTMLLESGVSVLVVGPECASRLDELLAELERPLHVICLDFPPGMTPLKCAKRHRLIFLRWDELQASDEPAHPCRQDATAYLLFTSGTTGVPKAVPISHGNVLSYLDYVCPRYGLGPDDRCSQTFDLTFDLSVHDMFVTWSGGSCLCPLPQVALLAPAKFIQNQQLTAWFSVPSLVMMMQRMRLLRPGCFPSVRLSLFCGEALPASLATAWQTAAPNSVVENLYGPTEATIAICHYQLPPDFDRSRFHNGIVPIGYAFPTQQVCVIDSSGRLVPPEESGELCLSGSQLTKGYSNSAEKTRQQFITIAEHPGRVWYKTGDLVRQDSAGCLHYLGRIDDQIQVMGHRVELQEVDNALRIASGTEAAIAVPWPPGNSRADAIYGFVYGDAVDQESILAYCTRELPSYMVPKQVFVAENFPLNANGKIDRRALGGKLHDLLRESDGAEDSLPSVQKPHQNEA